VVEETFLPNYIGTNGCEIEHLVQARGKPLQPAIIDFDEQVKQQQPQLDTACDITSDDILEILFTSGTTAHPKGVVMTHCNAIYAGIIHAWQCGLRQGERFFTSMPCFHIDFQFMAVMSALTVGGTVVVAERYSASKFWKQICTYRANVTDLMPMLIRTIMMQPETDWEKNHELRQAYFSMGMSTVEKDAFETRFNVRLLNCYGSTETVSCVTGDLAFGQRKWPSVGRPALSYCVRIADETGNELPANQIGEIHIQGVRGRSIMKEYYNEEDATAKAFCEDGWFRTNDLGYLDLEGWLYFEDRNSGLIKRSGESISSLEVENILTSHPSISEAAVIGIPDPLRGQAVKAVICLKSDCQLTVEEIIQYCEERLAKFKVPEVVEICTDFPRTCTGKIQKPLLK
jgi:crotonobetaine/carnitine-CoA ligase